LPPHVLFVDDESSIRLTLPAVLEQHGFRVTAAATVADALKAINSETFDALIADLNIGEPGDGFTVVSAMRRTQPHCVNFILTGYPAFETALQAIRQQVDDYLVKPADVQSLVEALTERLKNPKRVHSFQNQSLSNLLREHTETIVSRTLFAMKQHPRLSKVPLSDKQRKNHLTDVVHQLAANLESPPAEQESRRALAAAAEHGETRSHQGYSPTMLVDDLRVLGAVIYTVVQENLLNLNLSNVIPDLGRLNDNLEAQLQEALNQFLGEDAA